MKKLFAMLLCAVLALTAAACTKNETASSAVNTSSASEDVSSTGEETSSDADVSSTEDASSQDETYSMEEFVALSKDSIDAMKESFASQGLVIDVVAEGNSLVYRYQYSTAVGDTAAVKAALEDAIVEQDSVFEGVLTSVKSLVPDAESVIVEYLDADGSEIFSKEYK